MSATWTSPPQTPTCAPPAPDTAHGRVDAGTQAFEEPESPLGRLTPEQVEQLGREFDAIHEEVFADLGERDARYIRSIIALHRQLALGGRVLLIGSRRRPLWLLGTAALS